MVSRSSCAIPAFSSIDVISFVLLAMYLSEDGKRGGDLIFRDTDTGIGYHNAHIAVTIKA